MFDLGKHAQLYPQDSTVLKKLMLPPLLVSQYKTFLFSTQRLVPSWGDFLPYKNFTQGLITVFAKYLLCAKGCARGRVLRGSKEI